MRTFLRYQLLLLACFAFANAHTQAIVTDYNTCLQGVQGVGGVWIIPAAYEDLLRCDFGYIASRNGKYGVIDAAGNVRIPIAYDEVRQSFFRSDYQRKPPPYFRVRLNGKYGITDTTHRIIVPVNKGYIGCTEDTTFVAKESDNTWSFYFTDGNHFACPLQSKSVPRRVLPHRYSVGKVQWPMRNKLALVGDSGQLFLKREYDQVEGSTETQMLSVRRKGKYGFCSDAGRFVWPVSFSNPYKDDHDYRYVQFPARLGKGPACKDGKYGMITMDGQTLLPFVYTDILPFENYPQPRPSGNLWVVNKDGLFGIYDDVNGWKIPVSCTQIVTLETFFSDVDLAPVGLMLYEKNGLWGVTTTNGQEILPCVYEEFVQRNNDTYVLRNGDSLMTLGLITTAHVETFCLHKTARNMIVRTSGYHSMNRIVPQDRNFKTFAGNEQSTVYYHPRIVHDSLQMYGRKYRMDEGTYGNFVVPDSIMRGGCFYTQALTHPETSNGAVRLYGLHHLQSYNAPKGAGADLAFVEPKKTKRVSFFDLYYNDFRFSGLRVTANNDVITSAGKLVLAGDSLVAVALDRHGATGEPYIVARTYGAKFAAFDTNGVRIGNFRPGIVGDFSSRYMWRQVPDRTGEQWILTDLYTGKNLLPGKDVSMRDAPLWDSITIVDNPKHGARLYNITRRSYATAKGFSFIMPVSMNGSLFLVKTCSGNIGVMRPDGSLLMDTVFTGATPMGLPVHISDPWNDAVEPGTDYYPYYVLSNATSRVLLDIRTQTLASTQEAAPFIWDYCTKETGAGFKRLPGKEYPAATHFLLPEGDSSAYRAWHKRCIADTLFGSMRCELLHAETLVDPEDDYEYAYDYMDNVSLTTYCRACGGSYQSYIWTRQGSDGNFGATYVSDSVLSFSQLYHQYSNSKIIRSYCSTVFLFADGPHNMLLDSLFNPSSDWRNFVVNAVLNYVGTHTGIQGDCHNPALLPALMRDAWTVDADGLTLYPPGFSEYGAQLQVRIPWSDADAYLREDVKSKIVVTQQP